MAMLLFHRRFLKRLSVKNSVPLSPISKVTILFCFYFAKMCFFMSLRMFLSYPHIQFNDGSNDEFGQGFPVVCLWRVSTIVVSHVLLLFMRFSRAIFLISAVKHLGYTRGLSETAFWIIVVTWQRTTGGYFVFWSQKKKKRMRIVLILIWVW